VITAQSIGAALSTTLAGLVVVNAGYGAAFLTLGAVAAAGVAVCWFALPETGERSASDAAHLKQTAPPASGIAAE
jgi:predicted MFS family arabinose efflux permease